MFWPQQHKNCDSKTKTIKKPHTPGLLQSLDNQSDSAQPCQGAGSLSRKGWQSLPQGPSVSVSVQTMAATALSPQMFRA